VCASSTNVPFFIKRSFRVVAIREDGSLLRFVLPMRFD
jgi:hypothetical protein